MLPVRIFRPSIEGPVEQGHLAGLVEDACRSRVAKPDTIGLDLVKPNAIARNTVRLQCRLRRGNHILRVAEDFDRFVDAEYADNLGVDPRDRPEFAWPVGFMMRPADPGCPVRLPLRGHPEPFIVHAALFSLL